MFIAAALALALTSSASMMDVGAAMAQDRPLAPVTLSAQNADIREVLRVFSQSRGVNIVSSGEVEGNVSIELNEVPFDQALQAVVAMAGFQVVKRGSIYFVQTPAGDDAGAAILKDVRTYRLDYAKPEDLLPVVQEMLSSIGKATSYPPLRTLVAEDQPDVLGNVDAVIAALDVPPRQVLIEAEIIEARMTDDARFGIDWEALFAEGSVTLDGFANTAGGSNSQGLFAAWGKGDFTAALDALSTVEKLNTLAAPRVLAVDGTEAEIIIGDQLGFTVVTTVENVVQESVQFLDTGAQLKLTPRITGNGFILMRIHPELSEGVVQLGIPSKSTAQVTSDVLIRDGDTLLIGGLIRERVEKIRKGVPLFKDLPLFGLLFGSTSSKVSRSELIVLITPHILDPGETISYQVPSIP